jgi:hypothetical protein
MFDINYVGDLLKKEKIKYTNLGYKYNYAPFLQILTDNAEIWVAVTGNKGERSLYESLRSLFASTKGGDFLLVIIRADNPLIEYESINANKVIINFIKGSLKTYPGIANKARKEKIDNVAIGSVVYLFGKCKKLRTFYA